MSEVEKLINEVLALSEKATKGPWVTSIQHGQANIGNPYLGKTLMIPTSAGDPIQDCLLVSKYREAAPLLAKIVEKLIEQRDACIELLAEEREGNQLSRLVKDYIEGTIEDVNAELDRIAKEEG